ncbi:HEAT SHOCK PROTEIN DNAJ WITH TETRATRICOPEPTIDE REPEAT-CONTAINING PROTEIN [Salix purpurea]|uniref:HEAT SHOCK PROTEIN DNAJ WITH TETRATRICOPEPTIDE REPEAT-CONTAINING PROTEIN n=1 Tax=Salix purpurea TaxID=77065 RepID=A0A9Q0PPA1_SALPP|nr:HEAT SHOCK PROTEIN DNAJ WITH TETRATRICOPEPTIDE REPEAT-CONTAINING PROTEIN [Salix purpurea]
MQKLSINDKKKVVDGESKLSTNARFESGANKPGDATNGGGSSGAKDIKKFGLKSSENCGDILADSSENALPDRIKKLNIKDFVDTYNVTNKTSESFGSRERTGGFVGGENENILPTEFVFEGGMQGADVGGFQVPIDQPKVDAQPIGVARPSHAFSSSSLAGGDAFTVPPTGGLEKTDGFSFCKQARQCWVTSLCGKVKAFVDREGGSQEIPEASESYSPMDISPYQETLSDARNSRETSVASEESFTLDYQHQSIDSQPDVLNDAIDEDLVVKTQQMDINEEDMKYREAKEENSEYGFYKDTGAENYLEESISGAETESFKSANEEIDAINDVMVTSGESEASSSANLDSDLRTQFFSAVSSEDAVSSGFTFAASSIAQASPKRHHKKKILDKVDNDSFNSCANSKGSYASSSLQFTPFSRSSPMSPVRSKKASSSAASHVAGDTGELHRGQEINQVSVSASVAAQEACDRWRLRGNQAYTSGDLSQAEDCYTKATVRLPECLLGRMRDALVDCKMAAAIDPSFLRVQVRAANCYLALGEVEEAVQYFKRCLQLGIDVCVDRKIAVEASDGMQKAQKVSECMQRSAELLKRGAPNDAESALQVISEGLLISSYSEELLEMKAESLFMLRKYEELIQLCEHTFDSAKKNSPPLHADYHVENLGPELKKGTSFMIWRCCFVFKSYFHLGKLEEAIVSLEKQEELTSIARRTSLVPLAAIVQELLRHKAAGNEAFQAGKHSEAIEHYSAALSHCSLAIALDGNYLKAISRRATLYEMIRDYGQAANDLQRVVAVLTKQAEEKIKQSGHSDRTTNLANDLRQARLRLNTIEEEARKEIPLNMYLILEGDEDWVKEMRGIESSASASEVKKAYRKAALRHHPDKAGQSLARSDSVDDGLLKEIGEEVHKDADRLFKMIGEAYAMLSDPAKVSGTFLLCTLLYFHIILLAQLFNISVNLIILCFALPEMEKNFCSEVFSLANKVLFELF